MSWDEMKCTEYHCPCGKSTYTVKLFMDDWGRSEERWNMECPDCKQNYRLYSISYYHKARSEASPCWVPRSAYEEVEETREKLFSTRKEATNIAATRYLGNWWDYFKDIKIKKRVWEILIQKKKVTYPSLQMFYSDVNRKGLEAFLRGWFAYDELPIILEILSVKDADLEGYFELVDKIEKQLEVQKKQLAQLGVK